MLAGKFLQQRSHRSSFIALSLSESAADASNRLQKLLVVE